MIDIRTGKDIKDYPILEDPKLYIYIMLNNAGKIKIGKTKNIQQRYQSLCGSNSAGDKIVSLLVSPSTYLYTLENIMHDKFNKYRIPNTEWFYNENDPSGEKLFNSAANNLKLLFSSTDYERCNGLRKSLSNCSKEIEGGERYDN